MQVFTHFIHSPMGEIFAAATSHSIIYLQFYDEEKITKAFPYYLSQKKAEYIQQKNEILRLLEIQLQAYFDKKLQKFDIPTQTFGKAFQVKIWEDLHEINYGERCSYKNLTSKNHPPEKVRAVASAVAKNPILILYPCHRVVGNDGSLTGYAGKIWRKEKLLQLESTAAPLSLF